MPLTIFGPAQKLAQFLDDLEAARCYTGLISGRGCTVFKALKARGLERSLPEHDDTLAVLYADIRNGVKSPNCVPSLAAVVDMSQGELKAKEQALAYISKLSMNVESRALTASVIREILNGYSSIYSFVLANSEHAPRLTESSDAEPAECAWVGQLEKVYSATSQFILQEIDNLSRAYPALGFLADMHHRSANVRFSAHNGNLVLSDDVEKLRQNLLDVVFGSGQCSVPEAAAA